MTTWTRIRFKVPASQREAAAALLWAMGSCGFQEIEDDGAVIFDSYFEAEHPPAQTAQGLSAQAQSARIELLSPPEPLIYQADPHDWIVNWKKNYRSFQVGGTFYIHPSWEDPDPSIPVNLQIDPSHAFGTGTHESTQLCLLALPDLAPVHTAMLDLGTGSGVLAAAARRLNPRLEITALDNDPKTAEVARLLFADNAIDGVRLLTGELRSLSGRFDLVTANLTLDIFRRIDRDLLPRVGRTLLASGITRDQEEALVTILEDSGQLQSSPPQRLKGWSAIVFRRAAA
ncbi:MAG TPA: 50S ribosomal protein L11 methyltransferase [Acidobacteriota bacterium]|nr:50S ribosomal protein L11 methyltransferase [Acidobacteriota bacterium]